ncbi:MAG: hypothetical protein WBW76_11535 [Candidatus Cybelea sp.]
MHDSDAIASEYTAEHRFGADRATLGSGMKTKEPESVDAHCIERGHQ